MSQRYRSALCGHPLFALTNSWTRNLQLADIPPPQSALLGLRSVVCMLLLISRPTEGRGLSWPVFSGLPLLLLDFVSDVA